MLLPIFFCVREFLPDGSLGGGAVGCLRAQEVLGLALQTPGAQPLPLLAEYLELCGARKQRILGPLAFHGSRDLGTYSVDVTSAAVLMCARLKDLGSDPAPDRITCRPRHGQGPDAA